MALDPARRGAELALPELAAGPALDRKVSLRPLCYHNKWQYLSIVATHSADVESGKQRTRSLQPGTAQANPSSEGRQQDTREPAMQLKQTLGRIGLHLPRHGAKGVLIMEAPRNGQRRVLEELPGSLQQRRLRRPLAHAG